MDKRRQFFRPACEELEARRLLTGTSGATLDFQGFNLSFNAKPGFANSVTLSLSGDTYSFVTDSLNKITAVNNLPKGYTYQIAGCVPRRLRLRRSMRESPRSPSI